MAGGQRKYGNKKQGAKIYLAENRKARNKKRKITRHLKQQPNDDVARGALHGGVG